MAEDLAFMGAVELGKKITQGTVSSVEATKAMLDRIERLNGSLKCYEAVLAVQALGRPGARFVAIADQLNAATRVCRKRERVIAAPNARSDNSGLRLLSLLSGSFE
jgi:Asp-tRNA(Asn)/Glu-tRNA(Gln) amidotransferase A subunit family amidase